jgi:hypothetical protein
MTLPDLCIRAALKNSSKRRNGNDALLEEQLNHGLILGTTCNISEGVAKNKE